MKIKRYSVIIFIFLLIVVAGCNRNMDKVNPIIRDEVVKIIKQSNYDKCSVFMGKGNHWTVVIAKLYQQDGANYMLDGFLMCKDNIEEVNTLNANLRINESFTIGVIGSLDNTDDKIIRLILV